MKRRGVSLVETIISLFILAGAFAVIVALFHYGMSWQGKIEQRTLAAQLAKKRLAQLRAWARTHQSGNHYNYDEPNADWATAFPPTDPDYPGLQIVTLVTDRVLYSPDTTTEAPWQLLNIARRMDHSAKTVKVRVSDPADPGGAISLVSLIADPTRQMGEVVLSYTDPGASLTPATNVLNPSPGSWVDFSVAARAPDNTPIQDLFYDWYTVPLGGTGTVYPSRDGRTCRLINGVRTGWPPGLGGALGTVNTSGWVVVAVHGYYRGQGQPPLEYDVSVGSPYIKITLPPLELQ